MLKHLSRTLIIILVVVCPLTFSTDMVPDFKPACDVHSTHGKKATITIAAVQRSVTSPMRRSGKVIARAVPPCISTPTTGWSRLAYSGRAPPLPPPHLISQSIVII